MLKDVRGALAVLESNDCRVLCWRWTGWVLEDIEVDAQGQGRRH